MYVLTIVHNWRTQHNFCSYPPDNHEGGDEVLCWCGYLSGARCKWSAYGPADATATHPIFSCFTKIQIGLTFLVPS